MYRLCTGLSTASVEKNLEGMIVPMRGRDRLPERPVYDKEVAFLHKAAIELMRLAVIRLSSGVAKKASLSC